MVLLVLETILAVYFFLVTTCMAQHVLEELYGMRVICHILVDFELRLGDLKVVAKIGWGLSCARKCEVDPDKRSQQVLN